MTQQQYPWKRLWAPEGERVFRDGGFVYVPEQKSTTYFNAKLSRLEDLPHRCLILLGQPGLGKSTELKRYVADLEKRLDGEKDEVLFRDLNLYDTGQYLVEDIFKSGQFKAWKTGSHVLYLCLDSLDEARLRVETVVNILADQLQRAPLDRLFLRIACRSAEWPSSLGDTLKNSWSGEKSGDDSAYAVYSLVPLSRSDVSAAATESGLSADNFLLAVSEAHAESFAERPLTLQFLLASFSDDGSLPRQRLRLFEEGCRKLCTEWNASRKDSGHIGELSSDQRLAVAGRLAALSMLTNRNDFLPDEPPGLQPPGTLTLRELAGGKEVVSFEDAFEVTEAAVQETLQTALFTAKSDGSITWAHQSYAEALAARHLVNLKVDLYKLHLLLTHQMTEEVVPQLREVAAFVAEEREDFRDRILKTDDPSILLRMDLSLVGDRVRNRLVARLLQLLDDQKIRNLEWTGFRHLAHPGLSEQLKPYIQHGGKYRRAARFAFEIAGVCHLRELEQDLLQVASDPEENPSRRVFAVRAIAAQGDPLLLTEIKSILLGLTPTEDPDCWIRANLLDVLWPDHLSAGEMFPVLIDPPADEVHGEYRLFLKRDLRAGLSSEALPKALSWVEEALPNVAGFSLSPAVRRSPRYHAVRQVLQQTWQELENHQGLVYLFSRVVRSCLDVHKCPLLTEAVAPDFKAIKAHPEGRRKVIQCLVETERESGYLLEDTRDLLGWPLHLVLPEDETWLAEQVATSESADLRIRYLQLLAASLSNDPTPGVTEVFLELAHGSEKIRRALGAYLDPVDLDSEQASRHRHGRESPRSPSEDEVDQRLPFAWADELLAAIEDGMLDRWSLLSENISPRGARLSSSEPDMRTYPLWQFADRQLRQRLIDAAWKYLRQTEPNSDDWFGTTKWHPRLCGGYRALRLVKDEVPERLAQFSTRDWEKWAPVILGYPLGTTEWHAPEAGELLDKVYQEARDRVVDLVTQLIYELPVDIPTRLLLHNLQPVCVKRVEEPLIESLQSEVWSPKDTAELLLLLFKQDSQQARVFAEKALSTALQRRGEHRERAIHIAAALITGTEDCGGASVRRLTDSDTKFSQLLLETLHSRYRGGVDNFKKRLDIGELGDLLVLLMKRFPRSEYEWPDSKIAEFREAILNELKGRDTWEVIAALERVARELPDVELGRDIVETRVWIQQNTWEPFQPRELFESLKHPKTQIIRSEAELVEVILRSLKDLEAKLHGVTPQVSFLWNEATRGSWRPKEETALSTYVTGHLRDNLQEMVIGREVEIRPKGGGKDGQNVDIQVDAIVNNPRADQAEHLTVTIEVKGCWHKDLKTAMQSQLRDRYMAERGAAHGIYLVGWYPCSLWDSNDWKKRETPDWSLSKAREFFDDQAEELSDETRTLHAFVVDARLRGKDDEL